MIKKGELCRWCRGPLGDHRPSGICLSCCDARDERNRQISAGLIPYVPPDQRPGHRLYHTPDQKAVFKARGAKIKATKAARNHLEMAQGATQTAEEGKCEGETGTKPNGWDS